MKPWHSHPSDCECISCAHARYTANANPSTETVGEMRAYLDFAGLVIVLIILLAVGFI